MRKPSLETQLRTTKRELKYARESISPIIMELQERRRIGEQMSNICFNLGQENSTEGSKLASTTQQCMRDMRQNWDAIKRTRI